MVFKHHLSLFFMIKIIIMSSNKTERELSVFLVPTRYRVVKIMRSSSEVVLQTTKHTVIYPGSGPSSKIIALL
jgi:hypothetical protein